MTSTNFRPYTKCSQCGSTEYNDLLKSRSQYCKCGRWLKLYDPAEEIGWKSGHWNTKSKGKGGKGKGKGKRIS